MCLPCSTILFSWKNTRFRSARRTRKHGNWRQGLFLLLMIIVFSLPLSFSFFLSLRSILGIYPPLCLSFLYIFFPFLLFFVRSHKILRAPQRFFHLIARIECIFSTIIFRTNISTSTFRREIESSNSLSNSCTAFKQRGNHL